MGGLRSLLTMDTIFFILSKVVQFGIEPLNWALLFILLSVLFLGLRKPHLVKRFLLLGLMDLLVVGYLPTSELPLRFLEDLVPKSPLTGIAGEQIGAIVILGGAVEGGTHRPRAWRGISRRLCGASHQGFGVDAHIPKHPLYL